MTNSARIREALQTARGMVTQDSDAQLLFEEALTDLDALEEALQRLANPMGEPKTEEAVLIQAEVQQIAMSALSASERSGV